jgi:hypothetical protein
MALSSLPIPRRGLPKIQRNLSRRAPRGELVRRLAKAAPKPPALQILVEVAITQAIPLGSEVE